MKTLRELIEYLEASVDRADSSDCVALCLTVGEAEELLPGLKEALDAGEPCIG